MGASVERVGDGYRLSNELFDAVVSIAGDHVGIRIAATSAGKPLESKATPHRWHEEAGGWSWVLHEFILPPGAARVVLHIDAVRPKSVAITTEAWHATV